MSSRQVRPQLDAIDRRLLRLLQTNSRLSYAELARKLGCRSAFIHNKIRKLEATGYIQGYYAALDYSLLGWEMPAFLGINIRDLGASARATLVKTLQKLPQIAMIGWTNNAWDYIALAYTTDPDDLSQLVVRIRGLSPGNVICTSLPILGPLYQKPGPPVTP